MSFDDAFSQVLQNQELDNLRWIFRKYYLSYCAYRNLR